MKSFKPQYAITDNTYAAITSTVMNILITIMLFILINNYILPSSPLNATWLMTMILFFAFNSFFGLGTKRKIEFDRHFIIFWLLFGIGYIAFGIYEQAAPSIIALVGGFSIGSLINIYIKKIKGCRTP